MYTMRGCPWCTKAKDALDGKGIAYREIEYVRGEGAVPKMPNGEEVEGFPTIWVDGQIRGGFGELDEWTGACAV